MSAKWRKTQKGVLLNLPLMTSDNRQYQLWITKIKTKEGLPLFVLKASALKYDAKNKTFFREFTGAVFIDPESFARFTDALREMI